MVEDGEYWDGAGGSGGVARVGGVGSGGGC